MDIMENILGALPLFLAILTGLVILLLIGLSLGNILLLRMGVRNMLRRPAHTILLLGGLLLSTALITASFGINDSLDYSANARQAATVGNLDESITGTFSQEQVTRYLSAIRGNHSIEAVSTLYESYRAVTLVSPRTGFTLPNVNVLAVPADFDSVFGPLSAGDGSMLRFADLRPGEIDLGATLAQNFAAQPGDSLTLALGVHQATVRVRAILASDIAVNSSDVIFSDQPEIIVPLAWYQQFSAQPGLVNTFALTNRGHTGSAEVLSFLRTLFHLPSEPSQKSLSSNPSFTVTQLHPIRPDLLYSKGHATAQSFSSRLGAQAGAQFDALLPALTLLMVGAGMLLLALLFILLGAERRAELGISRAIGLQRSQLVLLLLIEGGGYGLIAALLGIPAGIGLVALELFVLMHIPLQSILSVKTGGSTFHMLLYLHVNLASMVGAFCLSVLVTVVVVLLVAQTLSRTSIVAAIRDLDLPPQPRTPLSELLPALIRGQSTPACRSRAAWELLRGLWVRGPLCLLLSGLLFWLANALALPWLSQAALLLAVAGAGLALAWLLTLIHAPNALARRIGFSLIGLGWLLYGIQPDSSLFTIFQPRAQRLMITLGAQGGPGLDSSALSLVVTDLTLIAGAVVLVMANGDLLVALLTACTSCLRRLAPLSRVSLAYPLTFRFRATVTISLLGLVVFLIMLIVTINLGAVQEAELATAAGGFQLSASSTHDLPANFPRLVQSNPATQRDIALASSMQGISHSSLYARQIALHGQPVQPLSDPIVAVSDDFLRANTLPLSARAAGYTSDRQVWDAVRSHPDYAVWYYEPAIRGISANAGAFQPFPVLVHDQHNHIHQLLVIGMLPPSTHWSDLFVSHTTFTRIYGPDAQTVTTCLLRLRSGVSAEQATRDLMSTFGLTYNLQIQSLSSSAATTTVANLALFFGCYLALGLFFGAVALGVTMSRAVIERQQQIGMLRALGFSSWLVQGVFLVEAGFLITIGLFVGTALALWTSYRVTSSLYPDFPLPLSTIVPVLLGCYLVAFLATMLPARRAARVRPADALRYE